MIEEHRGFGSFDLRAREITGIARAHPLDGEARDLSRVFGTVILRSSCYVLRNGQA